MPDPAELPNVHVIDHPLLAHMLGLLRDRRTRPPRFREMVAEIGGLLAYEATRDLEVDTISVQTPLEESSASRVRKPITIVPILRAGLGFSVGMHRLIPYASMGHIGMFRDEEKLSPVGYYENLPPNIAGASVLLADPMLATGGSAVAAVELLHQRGCTDVRFICLIAAPEGIEKLSEEHPDVPIFTAAIDRQLDDRGYIMPGLGDAGDRIFGTSDQDDPSTAANS